MLPERIEEGDLMGRGGMVKEKGGGGGEEEVNVDVQDSCEKRKARERGWSGGGKEAGGIIGEGKEAEEMLVNHKGSIEGLDAAAVLDLREVDGDLLLIGIAIQTNWE